jgi:glyoxylase-like metal-dependent hydrolase (beta-lactamase superfamily II)
VSARQVLDDVWLVGSGTDADARTDPHDCHCYLVWDGTGGFLVDAGTGLGASRWLENVREVCDPAGLGGVLLTHYHADHAGGAAAARDAGLPVLGHVLTAGSLATGDEDRTQVARARAAGVYPADYRLPSADLEPVTPGQVLASGGVRVEVVDAPGHCDGHLVFLVRGAAGPVLLSGDCLFADGRVSMQAIPDCRLVEYGETVVRLAERSPDVLLPGHGELVVGGAAEAVDRAAAAFQRLVPPPNFLSPW